VRPRRIGAHCGRAAPVAEVVDKDAPGAHGGIGAALA
jgi:hypothetical protein